MFSYWCASFGFVVWPPFDVVHKIQQGKEEEEKTLKVLLLLFIFYLEHGGGNFHAFFYYITRCLRRDRVHINIIAYYVCRFSETLSGHLISLIAPPFIQCTQVNRWRKSDTTRTSMYVFM